MARHADAFYACTPDAADRSLAEQTVAALAEQECAEVYDCRSTEEALSLALKHAAPKDCILVCGSLFLIGEAPSRAIRPSISAIGTSSRWPRIKA